MSSGVLLGLEYPSEYDNKVRLELEQLTSALQTAINNIGKWIAIGVTDVSFGSGVGGAMSWTVEPADIAGQYASLAYCLIGKTLLLTVRIASSTVGGTLSNILTMTLPKPYMAVRASNGACTIYDNTSSAGVAGVVRIGAGSSIVEFIRADTANFSASTNNTSILAQMAIEVA